MTVELFIFYLLAAVTVASGVMVVSARNPVHSVLFLILAFFNSAGLFILIGAEFLAMILVVVYVGAVAVLFMFVVMMLDINFLRLQEGFMQFLPVGLAGRHRSCWPSSCWSAAPGSRAARPAWPGAAGWRRAGVEHRRRSATCSTPSISTCSRPPA